jgi:hypothetical protein
MVKCDPVLRQRWKLIISTKFSVCRDHRYLLNIDPDLF